MSRITHHASRIVGATLLLFIFCFLPAPAQAAGPGQTCSSNAQCTDGTCGADDVGCYCSGLIIGTAGTCTEKRLEGESCVAEALCRTGLTCNGTTCERTAAPTSAPTGAATPSAEPEATEAPPTRTPGEFGYTNPLGTVNVNVVLGRVIRTALGFVGALFLAMFIYGGIVWMTAGGDAKKVESGRKALTNAAIGIVIIAVSYSVLGIVFEMAAVVRGG